MSYQVWGARVGLSGREPWRADNVMHTEGHSYEEAWRGFGSVARIWVIALAFQDSLLSRSAFFQVNKPSSGLLGELLPVSYSNRPRHSRLIRQKTVATLLDAADYWRRRLV